jgi:lactoylglutathione lyase
MGAITRPHHTGLHVSDLERSLAFYRDLLGFELVFAWNPQAPYIGELVGYPDVDLHAAVVRPPNSDVFLELLEYRNVESTPVDARMASPGTAHTAYYVDDVDSLYAALVAKGVKSVSPPVTPTIGPNAGGRAVYLLDPDGIRVELIETKRSFGEYASEQGR